MTEFNVQGVVLNLDQPDSNGEVISSSGVFVAAKIVPVTLGYDDDKVLGEAELEIKGNQVVAKGKLTVNCTADVLKKLTPAIKGMVISREEKTVTRCEILSVGMMDSENTDPTIQPLEITEVK